MGKISYNVLTIFGAFIMAAYSVVGTVGGEQAGLYQSVLLSIGLLVMVTLTFHLGMLWERKNEAHSI